MFEEFAEAFAAFFRCGMADEVQFEHDEFEGEEEVVVGFIYMVGEGEVPVRDGARGMVGGVVGGPEVVDFLFRCLDVLVGNVVVFENVGILCRYLKFLIE